MGQQTNKIQKRRRRLNYVERQKTKIKEAAVLRAPKKKAPSKKKEKEVAVAVEAPAE